MTVQYLTAKFSAEEAQLNAINTFVGRQVDVAELTVVLDEVALGHGCVVMPAGEQPA